MVKKFAIFFAAIAIMLNCFPVIGSNNAEESYILWENDFDTGYDPESTTIQGFDTFDTIMPAGNAPIPSYWDGTYQYGDGDTNYNGKVVRKVEDGNGMMSFQHSGSETTTLYVLKDMGTIPDKLKLVFQYRARVTISENTYYNFRWRDTYAPRMSGPTIQGYQRKILKYDDSGSTMDFNVGEWYDFTIVYDNLTNTRKTYINGEFVGEATNVNATYYRDGRAVFWLEASSLGNNTTIDVDDILLYKCGPTFDFKIKPASKIHLNQFYMEFNRPLSEELRTDQISIEGQNPNSVEKVGNKYKLLFSPPLSPGRSYTVNVNNVENILDSQVLNEEQELTTRAPAFFVSDMIVSQDNNELITLEEENLYIQGELNNELDDDKVPAIFAVQYDNSAKMIDLYKENISVEKDSSLEVHSPFSYSENTEYIKAFAWEGEECPIPISGFSLYSSQGRIKNIIDLEVSQYQESPQILFGSTPDYTAFEISVDTKESQTERFVGILLLDREGEIVHASQELTKAGKMQTTIPADYTNVGTYTLKVGVQKGDVTTIKTDYYSPNYIKDQIQTAINDPAADLDSVAGFLLSFGEYLELDLEEIKENSSKDRVSQIILNIKETKEDKTFAQIDEIIEAYYFATKMNQIYQGKNTEDILKNGQELGFEEDLVIAYKIDISSKAREAITLKLKGVSYETLSDLEEDIFKLTILNGVQRADNYKQVRALIKRFGESIGINMQKYNALKNPDYAETKLAGAEYSSVSIFASAANRLIEEANSKPIGGNSTPSVSRGGTPAISFSQTEVTPEPPVVSDSLKFNDVKTNDWFYEPVMWGVKKGLFIGTGNDRFMPDATLTWEQITIVLGRMGFEFQNEWGTQEINREDFAGLLFQFLAPSAKNIPLHEWIIEKGILIGNESGDLMLDKTLTRAECCTVLRRIES